MRAIVTGATGFVGSNVAKELIQQGYDVIAIGSNNEQPMDSYGGTLVKTRFYDFDWSTVDSIDAVFHQAAISDVSVKDADLMMKVNCDDAMKFFENAIAKGAKHIVYASSAAVYGNSPAPNKVGEGEEPHNPYGKAKLRLDGLAMDLAKQHPDVTIVGLRYCNVFGPGERHKGKMANLIYQIAQKMLKGDVTLFEDGDYVKRDQIYVKDVVQANILASQAKQSCVVNCGSGNPVIIFDIVKHLNPILGLDRKINTEPNPFAPHYQTHTELDMSRTKELIGFVPQWKFEDALLDYKASGDLTGPPL